MNLHGAVGPAISSVNPSVTVIITPSSGYTTDANHKRVPAYGAPVTVTAQVQSLGYGDLRQLDGLNLQGKKKGFYLSGNFEAISRLGQKGGDLISLPDGTVWLIVQVLEDFSDTSGWIKVAAVEQVP